MGAWEVYSDGRRHAAVAGVGPPMTGGWPPADGLANGRYDGLSGTAGRRPRTRCNTRRDARRDEYAREYWSERVWSGAADVAADDGAEALRSGDCYVRVVKRFRDDLRVIVSSFRAGRPTWKLALNLYFT